MADSVIIPILNNDWTDITLGAANGYFTNHADQYIIYLEAKVKPLSSSGKGHRLNPGNDKQFSINKDQTIWARVVSTLNTPASIILTETNKFPVDTGLNTTAFGDLKSESMTPVVQISAEYGLLDSVEVVIDTGGSGTATVVDNKFTAQSGTDASGLSAILSFRTISYRPGQGLIARFTSLFTVGVANSRQLAGLITAENSFAFGFIGTQFGIIHTHDGESESQELTITTPATGSETASVTVDGTVYSVPITSGTVQHNAYEISESLNAQVAGYDFASNNDQVIAQAIINDPAGSFAFSSSTAAGSWLQITSGNLPITDFVSQSNWSEDTFLNLSPAFDPTLGNVYQIQLQYLGFGGIKFFVEDPQTADFILVHIIKFANSSTIPSVTNPSFKIGWVARNFGNTSNLIVAGSSAAGFIEGLFIINSNNRAIENNQPSITLTPTNVISFRNRLTFGGRRNRSNIFPISVSLSSQTNKSVFINILADPIFGGDVDFQYIDKLTSTMEVSKTFVSVTGGRIIESVTIVAGSSSLIEFNKRMWHFLAQFPGQVFCISAHISGGASSDVQATGTWAEDI